MDRRAFIGSVAVSIVATPLAAYAQQTAKAPRIGVLVVPPFESPGMQPILDAFRQGLRERGYVEGQNIVIEYRSAGGRFEQVPSLASELVRLGVEVIVTGNSLNVHAVQQVSATIPIVAVIMGDPVEDGLAASLARPGGNVTGLTFLGRDLVLKRLELLKQMLPTVSRAAVLWHRDIFGERRMKEVQSEAAAAARSMGVQLQLVEIRGPGELDGAFSAIARGHADALVPLPSGVLYVERRRIVEFAATQRLPAMYSLREYVAIGGLISYGPSLPDLFRRSTTYVDKTQGREARRSAD
jgi:putative ABC transport system substrate-binding protein